MYTIKSESAEGTYYLSKDWRKNNAFWVDLSDLRMEMLFKTKAAAKASLTKRLKIMPEYATDTFSVVTITF